MQQRTTLQVYGAKSGLKAVTERGARPCGFTNQPGLPFF